MVFVKVWLVLLPPELLMLLLVLTLLNIVRMPLGLVGRIDLPPPFPPLQVPVTVVGLLAVADSLPPPQTVAVLMNVQGNARKHAQRPARRPLGQPVNIHEDSFLFSRVPRGSDTAPIRSGRDQA
ncbi:hypothetical protein [Streptomyces sp. NBC_00154]|uniref:hypothetical protein n=1 Tax=Streptomyces sp. NBC_00154 TaxID=2975670 RepID=UPI00224CEF32|nr:hypothetical protein [Streptomyces sp. NBC_00154]MCX5317733.1 hypothetical protein [Streptomyces sp. NBC_00154]